MTCAICLLFTTVRVKNNSITSRVQKDNQVGQGKAKFFHGEIESGQTGMPRISGRAFPV